MPGLLPGKPLAVTLDEETLGDPNLHMAKNAISIRPRSGSATAIDVAVTPAADVEGIIAIRDPAKPGQSVPQRGVRVDLIRQDGSIADSTITAFDGLYVFAGVAAGRYRVAVSEADLKRLEMATPEPTYIDVPRTGGAMTLAATEIGKAATIAKGYAVILGEYDSEFGRLADWLLIRPRVEPLKPRVQLADVPSPKPDRFVLALGPYTKRQEAEGLCRGLRDQGIDCSVRASDGKPAPVQASN